MNGKIITPKVKPSLLPNLFTNKLVLQIIKIKLRIGIIQKKIHHHGFPIILLKITILYIGINTAHPGWDALEYNIHCGAMKTDTNSTITIKSPILGIANANIVSIILSLENIILVKNSII